MMPSTKTFNARHKNRSIALALPHGLFDNQNSHRKSKGEFMNVGNIFDVSMLACRSGSGGGKTH